MACTGLTAGSEACEAGDGLSTEWRSEEISNPFETLDMKASRDAIMANEVTTADIHCAYRKMARLHHPDKCQSGGDAFHRITVAKDELLYAWASRGLMMEYAERCPSKRSLDDPNSNYWKARRDRRLNILQPQKDTVESGRLASVGVFLLQQTLK